jgi:hypothetical protein
MKPALILFSIAFASHALAAPPAYKDTAPKQYNLTARASLIDPRAKEHPEIGFVFEKEGKPADTEKASVDTRVAPQGKLVIWLMGHNQDHFDRISSYGLHAIQVHYANGWFGKLSKETPAGDDLWLSNIRLEAAIGEDVSPAISIPKPDSIMERSYQFVKWLDQENPQGNWSQFLSADGKGLQWDKVILSGASHGATTAARFAKHTKVDRVVMFCGPRDQLEAWQKLPSATADNRYFGFSHVLDGGWSGDHYCRSWIMLGLNNFGPVVDIDATKPPFGNTRRLVTAADVGGNVGKAHSCVTPGKGSPKNKDGNFLFEDVWRYLYTHPVEEAGEPVKQEADCRLDLRNDTK